jgi:hypothetical protein
MPDITLKDVESFHAWAHMLIHNEESYLVPEANVQMDIYGQDDSAYLVLDIYSEDNSITQYVFIVADEVDDHKTIVFLFDFLKALDFSLQKLLDWLKQAKFVETEAGTRAITHGLAICRSNPNIKIRQGRA